MSPAGSVTLWIAGLKAGNETVAQKLWERYFQALLRHAIHRLRGVPNRAVDAEDIVSQAFMKLCLAARDKDRLPKLTDRHDLWTLLLKITDRTVIDARRTAGRQKRGSGKVRGESAFDLGESDAETRGLEQVTDHEPSPEFALEVAEEYGRLLNLLADESLCAVANRKLEGYTNEEIAQHLGVALSTVERKLRRIRTIWEAEVGREPEG